MSTGEDQVIDKQPQPVVRSDHYVSDPAERVMQTTENGQVQQPGFKALERLNKLEVVQRLDTLEGLLAILLTLPPLLSLCCLLLCRSFVTIHLFIYLSIYLNKFWCRCRRL